MISDVDGTLVTQEKIVTRRAKEAVAKLREAGVKFSITSGRPPRGTKMVIDELKLTEPIAAFNGGIFVSPDLKVIQCHRLDPAVSSEIIDTLAKNKLDVWIYTEDDWYIRDPKAPHVEHEAWTVKFSAKVAQDFSPFMQHIVKIVGVSDDFDAVAKCESQVQGSARGRYSASRSQPYYLDVTHPQANKGEVVLELSRLLNIPTEQIATIGDGPNDTLMFRKSGLSIAMGNGSTEVQKAANVVTASNEAEGFAQAIEKFVLPKSSSTPA